MSEILDNGYRAGEASNGKGKMSPFEGSQREDEFMIGYCLARAEDQGAGGPMFYYSLGLHAGYYGLTKNEVQKNYDPSQDYNEGFYSGYEDGQDERDAWFNAQE